MGGATQNMIRKAQILQNKIARFVTKLPRKTRVSTLMRECNWLRISELT